jgi:endonuclease/exonuclease/phosphatase family metal-dependent hydrolase
MEEAMLARNRNREQRSQRRALRDPFAERRELLAQRVPYLALVRGPSEPAATPELDGTLEVATYNVHRWAGPRRGEPSPELASEVVAELGVDVIGLQEVLRPFDAEDPLERLADDLQLHVAFVSTRVHRQGELGNAILSRWPMTSVLALDLSHGGLERRSALAVEFHGQASAVTIVATHLSLVDRTRERQVQQILDHPQLQGPALLLGDMNAWRRCPATRQLNREFTDRHHNDAWPASFPAGRPLLALDRIYAREAQVTEIRTHDSEAARKGSDHLPVVARIKLF